MSYNDERLSQASQQAQKSNETKSWLGSLIHFFAVSYLPFLFFAIESQAD